MYDSQRYFCERNAGVKNNIKVDCLLLKSGQCNQRCLLLWVSRSGHFQYCEVYEIILLFYFFIYLFFPILFNTVNAEVWGLSQPPPFPISEGFGFASIS